MKIIGLTGQSGAGKSAACAVFEKHGIPCVNTDVVYHSLLKHNSPLVCELVRTFGFSISDNAGGIDRKKLAGIVFSFKESLNTLNKITHRHILSVSEDMLKEYEAHGAYAAVIDAPQLFESGFDKKCDITLGITADKETLIKRIISRDNISVSDAEKRLKNQHPKEFFIKNCTYTIENTLGLDELEKAVVSVINEIKEL